MGIKVAAFSGSLRKYSFTTKLIKAFKELAPEGIEVELIDISQLPFINQDLENDLPQAVKDLHKAIAGADAILLASPEYNRSYSPVLKNALDWGSRPEGANKWRGKPVAVAGCSPYKLGAFGAVHHLRQVLTYLDMPTLQQPEFYLAKAADKFDAQDQLTDKETKQLIFKFWEAFKVFISKLK